MPFPSPGRSWTEVNAQSTFEASCPWGRRRSGRRAGSDRPLPNGGAGPAPFLEGVTEAQTEDEDHEADRADREQRVAWHAQPAQRLHEALAEELVAARIPVTVFDRGHGLKKSDGQE